MNFFVYQMFTDLVQHLYSYSSDEIDNLTSFSKV